MPPRAPLIRSQLNLILHINHILRQPNRLVLPILEQLLLRVLLVEQIPEILMALVLVGRYLGHILEQLRFLFLREGLEIAGRVGVLLRV